MEHGPPPKKLLTPSILVVAALLCLIVAVGAYLRFRDLSGPGLWFDEGITLEQSTRPSLSEAIEASRTHPPLTRLLVRVSVSWFGSSGPGGKDFAVRLPSALMGTLAILVIFFCVRRITEGDDAVALVASALYAASSFGVYYGQEARYYAGMVLFGAWAYHGALLIAEKQRSLPVHLYLALGLTLGMYNHHLGVAAFLSALLWILPALWTAPRRNWVVLAPWVVSGALFYPWLRFALGDLESQARPWIPEVWRQIPDVVTGWFTGRSGLYHLRESYHSSWIDLNVATSAGIIVVFGIAAHGILRRRGLGPITLVALLGTVLGAAVLHHLSDTTRFLHHKYLAFVYPLVALCVAELVCYVARSVARLKLWSAMYAVLGRGTERGTEGRITLWHRDYLLVLWAGVLCLGLVLSGQPLVNAMVESHGRHRWGSPNYLAREHYQEVAAWVQARRSPATLVVVFDPYVRKNNTFLVRYYGVTEPVVSITRTQLTIRRHIPPRARGVLAAAQEMIVVTPHASEEERQLIFELLRRPGTKIVDQWGHGGAEGFTHAVHLRHYPF